MIVLVFPCGSKLNVDKWRVPVINEVVISEQQRYQVSHIENEIGKDLEQKTYIYLYSI